MSWATSRVDTCLVRSGSLARQALPKVRNTSSKMLSLDCVVGVWGAGEHGVGPSGVQAVHRGALSDYPRGSKPTRS